MYEVTIDESYELYGGKEDTKVTFETYDEAVNFSKVLVEQHYSVKIEKIIVHTEI